ncbi:hypothetical protein C8R43DRAFT_959781 [Mycena crocata]|nr:hypothetical protein C8R43DRAFT_959781 [Mycena crocata]
MQFLKLAQLVVIACAASHVTAAAVSNPTAHAVANPVNVTTRTVAHPINIGTVENTHSTVAWTSGVDPCAEGATIVQNGSGNFCGIFFTLAGQPGQFVFNGCGGSLWVDRDNFFYANCESFSEAGQCGFVITTTYHCA